MNTNIEINNTEIHDDLKKWIIDNKPAEGTPAKFYSHEFMFYTALNLRELPGETLTAKDIETLVLGELERIYEDLWQDHNIAVQMFATESGRTGVRIMNLL